MNIMKIISNKRPSVLSSILLPLGIVLGYMAQRRIDELAPPSVLSWIVLFVICFCTFFGGYILFKNRGPYTIKEINIYDTGLIRFTYVRTNKFEGGICEKYKNELKAVKAKNCIVLCQSNTMIAKLYKSRLQKTEDWEWLNSYFDK